MSDRENLYAVLGVSPDASRDEIRAAYRDRVDGLLAARQNAKPEKARSRARAAEERELQANRDEVAVLHRAWNVLSDPYQRGRYDQELERGDEPGTGDATDGQDQSVTGTDVELVDDRPPLTGWRRLATGAPRERGSGGKPAPAARPGRDDPRRILRSRRNGAAALDLMVAYFVLTSAFQAAISLLSYDIDEDRGAVATLYVVLTVVVCVLILWVPMALKGQTLGQVLFGVKIVRVTDGEAPGLRATALRFGLPTLLGVAYIWFVMLAYFAAVLLAFSFAFSKDGRSIGDKWAGTEAIAVKPRLKRVR